MKVTENITINDIKKFYSEEFSCIKKVSTTYTLLLLPKYYTNIKIGIKNELNAMLKMFVNEFNGILLAYENLKILSPSGWLFDTNPYLHVNIRGDFYIFSPSIGDILQGTVVKKSPNHVGCLVHGIFNVSSYIPMKMLRGDWCGSRVSERDTLQLKITRLKLLSVVPFIEGDIVADSIIKASPMKSTSQTSSSYQTLFNDEDSGISSIDKSEDLEVPVKKKKKKKVKGNNSMIDGETVNEELVFTVETEKKSAKLKVDKSATISPKFEREDPNEELQEITPKKKKTLSVKFSKSIKQELESDIENTHSKRKSKRKREETQSPPLQKVKKRKHSSSSSED